jgi:hypothetical protein
MDGLCGLTRLPTRHDRAIHSRNSMRFAAERSWLRKTKRREPRDQLGTCLGPGEALEQFLEHETCREDWGRSFKILPNSSRLDAARAWR